MADAKLHGPYGLPRRLLSLAVSTMSTTLICSLQPDIAKAFLRRHVSDSTREELLRFVATAIAQGDANDLDDLRRAVIALESTLDRDLPPSQLLMMVEFDGNIGLDDGSEAGARAWLETLTLDLRRGLGAEAPPARGTHQLDRVR